jgi:single-strand DNA-binding protein
VAVNRKYKDEDEVLFLAVVAFGKTAENVSAHMEKGKRVLVSGRLQSRKYETSSGDKRETYEVVAEKVVFL